MNKYYGTDYLEYLKRIQGVEELVNEKERIKKEYAEGNISSKQRDFFTRMVNQKIQMFNQILGSMRLHDQHLTLMMMEDEGYDAFSNQIED
jgi:hypothetical protein